MTTPVSRSFVFHFSNIGMVDEAASFDNIEALEAFMRSRTKAFTTDVYVSDNCTGCKYGFCYRDGTIEWYYSDIFTNSPQSVSTRVSKPKITANDLLLQCTKSGYWSGGTAQQAPFTRNFIYGVTLLPTVSPTTKEQSMKFEQRYYLNGNNIEYMDNQEIDAVLVLEEQAIEELKARKFQTKQVQAMIKQREEELAGVIKFLDDRFDAKQAKQ
jgi:hypothetical protein